MASVVTCTKCGRQQMATSTYCMQCGNPLPGMGTGMLPPNALLQSRYIIVAKLGQGGFGAVYRVADLRLAGTFWAVKEMSDAAIADPVEKARAVAAYKQEAQLLAQLTHANIPKVTDFFTENNKHYIVMEFVPGETLKDRIERQNAPCSEQEVRLWAGQLCDVLAYLHSQNPPIIFRDLKPANLMLTPQGQIKLIDFGIARLFKPGKASDTQVVGTPGFASPEQYGRGQTDGRSDVYSLGVVMHHLLTLHDPTSTPFNLPPAGQLRPTVSPQMEQIIMRATQSDVGYRFQTVQEMQQVLAAPPPAPPMVPTPPTVPTTKGSRGVPIWLLLGLIGLALGVGAAIAGGLIDRDGSPEPPPAVVVPTLAPVELPTELPTERPSTPPTAQPTNAPAPEPTLAPTPEPPENTPVPPQPTSKPSRDPVADRATILNLVDYYGGQVKTEATTRLDNSNLPNVFVEPVLTRQLQSVCDLRNNNRYYTYANRDSQVESVTFDDEDHATVLLRVKEDRIMYRNNRVEKDFGREDYRAIYTLERLNDRWYINCFIALADDAPAKCEVKLKSPDPCAAN